MFRISKMSWRIRPLSQFSAFLRIGSKAKIPFTHPYNIINDDAVVSPFHAKSDIWSIRAALPEMSCNFNCF